VFDEQVAAGRELLARENVAVERVVTVHRADMQFQGQSHILPVAVPSIDVGVDALRAAFTEAYWKRFGVALPEIRPVLVNLHTAVIGRRKAVDLASIATHEPAATLADARRTVRRVWFEDGGWHDTPVYRRDRLPAEACFEGPAIVEQLDCTTVVEPGNRVEVDPIGNLLVSV
jgi:N-methylhydantoinase A